jgi:hypothetical protein
MNVNKNAALRSVFLCCTLVCAIAMQPEPAKTQQTPASAGQKPVSAIDILLEPDATMIQHAQAANAGLLKSFPKGFSLGAEHAPHVTVLQRYVNTTDLDKVYGAASKVFAKEKPTSWKLKAFKYYYIPQGPIGLGGIVIEPTADLLRLQKELIDAIAPFTAPTGTAAAYVTTPQDPDILAPVIEYVRVFVPEHSGDKYSPHVTTGIGTVEYLDALLAAPFETFTFSPVEASVYHLGNYGTAMTKLHSFELKK